MSDDYPKNKTISAEEFYRLTKIAEVGRHMRLAQKEFDKDNSPVTIGSVRTLEREFDKLVNKDAFV